MVLASHSSNSASQRAASSLTGSTLRRRRDGRFLTASMPPRRPPLSCAVSLFVGSRVEERKPFGSSAVEDSRIDAGGTR